MATINPTNSERVFQIQKFLGLNESQDGGTQLKYGEATVQENWQITDKYHLRIRPGYRVLHNFNATIRGLWTGYVAGREKTVCAADGGVWDVTNGTARRIGDITDADVSFFGFGGKLYMLNGSEYLFWDGEGFVDVVEGYAPLIFTAMTPSGSGTALENINRLTGKRRVRYSADGESTEYHLPEQGLASIDKVYIDGVETGAYTKDTETGIVTFAEAPISGNDNVEIHYTAQNSLRAQVESMRHWETFNGYADTRVFLYGDGSAKALYCGITETGVPSAEYFPDLYEIIIGDENMPLTGMVKQYSRLISFKPNGTYSTEYSSVTLADGSTTAGFYTVPINREVGNDVMGQVQLVYNYPRSICKGNVYTWSMASNAVRDERNAKVISERVQGSLQEADTQRIFTFDNARTMEYFMFLADADGTVLVHRYDVDAWYKYTGLAARCACAYGKDILLGMEDGRICVFSEDIKQDAGKPIAARFESGMMDFGSDYNRKHSSVIWVSLKPAGGARITISAQSDRRSNYAEKEITADVANFAHASFAHWSFETNQNPKMRRVKLKVKKFVYYKLVINTTNASSDTTVLGVDVRTRYTGYVK